MNKASTRILLILIVMALAALACVGGGGGVDGSGNNSNNVSSSNQSGIDSPDATATYGAQQLHIQLTEIAKPGDK